MGKTKQKVSYAVTRVEIPITSLHEKVEKVPPVVAKPTKEGAKYNLNWLSATGSGIFLAGDPGRPVHGLFAQCAVPPVLGHDQAGEILAAHHLGDAGPGIRDALLRDGRDDGPCVRPHRRALSLLRNVARLVGCRADRLRHSVQRSVRRPAEESHRSSSV